MYSLGKTLLKTSANINYKSGKLNEVINNLDSRYLKKFLPKMLNENPDERISFKQLYSEINDFLIKKTKFDNEYFLNCEHCKRKLYDFLEDYNIDSKSEIMDKILSDENNQFISRILL